MAQRYARGYDVLPKTPINSPESVQDDIMARTLDTGRALAETILDQAIDARAPAKVSPWDRWRRVPPTNEVLTVFGPVLSTQGIARVIAQRGGHEALVRIRQQQIRGSRVPLRIIEFTARRAEADTASRDTATLIYEYNPTRQMRGWRKPVTMDVSARLGGFVVDPNYPSVVASEAGDVMRDVLAAFAQPVTPDNPAATFDLYSEVRK